MWTKAEAEKVLNNEEQLINFARLRFTLLINSNGFLEKHEMMKVMGQVTADVGCEAPTEQQVEEVLKELDDGKI